MIEPSREQTERKITCLVANLQEKISLLSYITHENSISAASNCFKVFKIVIYFSDKIIGRKTVHTFLILPGEYWISVYDDVVWVEAVTDIRSSVRSLDILLSPQSEQTPG